MTDARIRSERLSPCKLNENRIAIHAWRNRHRRREQSTGKVLERKGYEVNRQDRAQKGLQRRGTVRSVDLRSEGYQTRNFFQIIP